jgi:hypothetical protein
MPVIDWEPGTPVKAGTTYRISSVYDWKKPDATVQWLDNFDSFLQDPASQQVEGLIVGRWESAYDTSSAEIVEAIVTAREKLPHLTALFVGDMTSEECEISWITQSDVSPLLEAYPQLRYFGARGGNALTLGVLNHANLERLIIESGGLNGYVVQSVCASQYPKLKHLELWLGTDEYGATTTIEDLQPLLAGTLFPALEYLGLRDSELADPIAIALKDTQLVARLKVLDLSLGTLGDEGAQALLDNPAITNLEKLDLHYHFCSTAMMSRLQKLPIQVDVDDKQEPDEYDDESVRYVAVGE